MFAAFDARDLDAFLETVHSRSRWVYYGANPGVLRSGFKGRAEVRSFFERIMKGWTFPPSIGADSTLALAMASTRPAGRVVQVGLAGGTRTSRRSRPSSRKYRVSIVVGQHP